MEACAMVIKDGMTTVSTGGQSIILERCTRSCSFRTASMTACLDSILERRVLADSRCSIPRVQNDSLFS